MRALILPKIKCIEQLEVGENGIFFYSASYQINEELDRVRLNGEKGSVYEIGFGKRSGLISEIYVGSSREILPFPYEVIGDISRTDDATVAICQSSGDSGDRSEGFPSKFHLYYEGGCWALVASSIPPESEKIVCSEFMSVIVSNESKGIFAFFLKERSE